MHVEFTRDAPNWEGWSFGDLAAAVCRAVEVVGPNANVSGIAAHEGADGTVTVALGVPGPEEVARLQAEATSGEYEYMFLSRPTPWAWVAEINRVRLLVAVPRGDRR